MKSLVTYFSESSNTEKLAKAIYKGINESEKDMLPLSEADPKDYEVIYIGFPVQASSVPGKVETFIKSITDGKKLAFFVTTAPCGAASWPSRRCITL